jgi:hypothetical protein
VAVPAADAGQRELEIWLLGFDGHRIERLSDRSADELGRQLLRAADASATGSASTSSAPT